MKNFIEVTDPETGYQRLVGVGQIAQVEKLQSDDRVIISLAGGGALITTDSYKVVTARIEQAQE